MNIGQTLKISPNVEIDLLLAHIVNEPKEFLHLHPEYRLSPTQAKKLTALIKRRKKGEPIAYILGYKYFYGLKFAVNRNVLVPRPESEWLVEQGVKYLKNNPAAERVLDMGTGSGCLIISLAATTRTSIKTATHTTRASSKPKKRPIQWVGADISKLALAMAKQNSRQHKTPVKFIQSNLFKSIKGKFDFIMANLPYVPAKIFKELHSHLKYEPKLALMDKGKDEMIIHKFLASLPKHLTDAGQAVMEIDPRNKPGIEKFARQNKLQLKINFHKDYQKLWRYAVIKKLPSG